MNIDFEALEHANPTRLPRFSPWGAIQTARALVPGVWSISTASHGGMFLSRSRLAALPPSLRETPFSSGGWFEEDIDALIPILAFADLREVCPVNPARAILSLAYIQTGCRADETRASLLALAGFSPCTTDDRLRNLAARGQAQGEA